MIVEGKSGGSNAQSITPSNTNPVALAADVAVKPTASGYAIQSYQEKTPDTSGVSFSTGIVKMSRSGYAYSSKPSLTETTLWTNSSPASAFAAQTVNFSKSMSNYDFIKFTFQASSGSTRTNSFLVPFSEFKYATSNNPLSMGLAYSSTTGRTRLVYYANTTGVYFSSSYKLQTGSQSVDNTYVIPQSIIGVKKP